MTGFARRTLWDGAQELAEIQAPYDTVGTPLQELDSGWPLLPYSLPAGADPNPFYGRVVYGPGLAVDQPLSVTRYDYRDYPNGANALTWPTFSLVPYWNYRGLAGFGTFSDGTSFKPYATGGTSCPALGNTTTQRCVLVQWQFAHSAYDQNRGKVRWWSWQGSLLEGKRDQSGFDYRRARVYDPATGRFTQEDPLGLAGGLNAYGFADGDPVNFSDPFGLCPPKDENTADCAKGGSTRTVTQRVGDFAAGFGDFVSFGATKKVRELWDCADCVDYGSGVYTAGQVAGGVAGAAEAGLAVARFAFGVTSRVAIHGAHHTFPLVGKAAHLQVNVWRIGVSESGRAFRIPLPWR